jgi:hypothetical protein
MLRIVGLLKLGGGGTTSPMRLMISLAARPSGCSSRILNTPRCDSPIRRLDMLLISCPRSCARLILRATGPLAAVVVCAISLV